MATTYSEGDYLAKVIAQGFESSIMKETPFFFLQLSIIGRYDSTGCEIQHCPQYERSYRQYVNTETGVNLLKRDLKTLAVEFGDLKQLSPDFPGHLSLVGREIKVFCKIEMYKGKPQEWWEIPCPRAKLDPIALQRLSDQFTHLFGDQSNQPKPPATPPPANPSDEPK
jgi:hypothetical protein